MSRFVRAGVCALLAVAGFAPLVSPAHASPDAWDDANGQASATLACFPRMTSTSTWLVFCDFR